MKLIAITILIILTLSPALLYFSIYKLFASVEHEQTWAYSHCKNPFDGCDTGYNYVIDAMDGYVLYVKNGNDTISEKIEWFLVGSSNVTENIKR